ncbi:hypothetical protein [Streptomyces sp. MAR4 CNX-425]|uniref:MmyB family transcriptional regulator n=1 Tax=Streptomyces sp. MAR4 CNX-425 TaxID=3406343 RepID=UPI003B5030C0
MLESGPEFARLWAWHDARCEAFGRKRIVHVGALTLTMQTFDVRAAPGHELIVYRAERRGARATRLARGHGPGLASPVVSRARAAGSRGCGGTGGSPAARRGRGRRRRRRRRRSRPR